MQITDGRIINLAVTLSNFVGVIGIFILSGLAQKILLMSVVTSILMHLSETKHGLPGIFPFNKMSKLFLWLDRIAAYLALFFSLTYMMKLNIEIVCVLLLALLSIVTSECIISDQWGLYFIAHSIWHILIYYAYIILTY